MCYCFVGAGGFCCVYVLLCFVVAFVTTLYRIKFVGDGFSFLWSVVFFSALRGLVSLLSLGCGWVFGLVFLWLMGTGVCLDFFFCVWVVFCAFCWFDWFFRWFFWSAGFWESSEAVFSVFVCGFLVWGGGYRLGVFFSYFVGLVSFL